MILKLNNKSENFYNYLGRLFGSRIVELTTQDRIYDDNNKEWYIYVQKDIVTGFVSVSNSKIKNIYSTNIDHLTSVIFSSNKLSKKSFIISLSENRNLNITSFFTVYSISYTSNYISLFLKNQYFKS